MRGAEVSQIEISFWISLQVCYSSTCLKRLKRWVGLVTSIYYRGAEHSIPFFRPMAQNGVIATLPLYTNPASLILSVLPDSLDLSFSN